MKRRTYYTSALLLSLGIAAFGFGSSASAQTMPDPAATPVPAATAVPATVPAPAPTPDANGVTPVKQGGINENSNGPSWLEKFTRKPGPDTSAIPPAPAPRTKHAVKVKVKKVHPPQ